MAITIPHHHASSAGRQGPAGAGRSPLGSLLGGPQLGPVNPPGGSIDKPDSLPLFDGASLLPPNLLPSQPHAPAAINNPNPTTSPMQGRPHPNGLVVPQTISHIPTQQPPHPNDLLHPQPISHIPVINPSLSNVNPLATAGPASISSMTQHLPPNHQPPIWGLNTPNQPHTPFNHPSGPQWHAPSSSSLPSHGYPSTTSSHSFPSTLSSQFHQLDPQQTQDQLAMLQQELLDHEEGGYTQGGTHDDPTGGEEEDGGQDWEEGDSGLGEEGEGQGSYGPNGSLQGGEDYLNEEHENEADGQDPYGHAQGDINENADPMHPDAWGQVHPAQY